MVKGPKVNVSNCMTVEELNEVWHELHKFLQKLSDYYDKEPWKRKIIENHLGKSIESVIGGVEHTMYAFDRFKDQLEKNAVARMQFTMQAIKVKEDMDTLSKHLKTRRRGPWNASENR